MIAVCCYSDCVSKPIDIQALIGLNEGPWGCSSAGRAYDWQLALTAILVFPTFSFLLRSLMFS
jgi:hypothetical protein